MGKPAKAKGAKGAKQGRGAAPRLAALLGVAASVLVLAAGALLERVTVTVTQFLVGLLDRAAGVDLRPPETHLERYLTSYQYEDRREGDGAGPGDPAASASYQHALDEEAMLARSTFPIPPRELVGLTKNLIAADLGIKDPKLLSRDFQFCSPVVGPLKRRAFIAQWEQFRIDKAFQAQDNAWGFHVDPREPNRCWWFTRVEAVHVGQLNIGWVINPTGNTEIFSPPQANSALFDEAGRCYRLTTGYVMDKSVGNTGGLGALFGWLHALGKGHFFP